MRKFLVGMVVLVVAAVGVGLGLVTRHRSGAISTSTTTTSTAAVPIAPLTGLPDPSGLSLKRPALTVKIENTPEALPQWGVESADVVYEEIVNGGITRLAAVFNSHAPAKIGPVRSVRPTDTQVVWPLGGIFAFSGGAAYALNSIATVPGLDRVDESSAGTAMFRDPTRVAPHNLYAVGPKLFTFAGTPIPPPALFQYRSLHGITQGTRASAVSQFVVPFPSIYPVTWTWNPTSASWDRTLFGQPDLTGTGVRESPKNVIVMFVNYVNGIGTMSSYANLQGSGTADVFTNGEEVTGTWSRGSSPGDVVAYRDAKGQPILLTPGQTWVELLNTGTTLSITKAK
ncbi:MAG TPA: DUF3048 domain-containing protein [Acidimicrobiales bacterium]|nr:MAG: hypothetical protein B7X07_06225 [Actinobacteria bacterium 21-64-8]HQU00269.1 DUF3048 domain-containing protein [Acidimicrobiales bacterium]